MERFVDVNLNLKKIGSLSTSKNQKNDSIMTFQPINHFNSKVYGHYASICQTHILLDSVKQFITNYTYKAPFAKPFQHT